MRAFQREETDDGRYAFPSTQRRPKKSSFHFVHSIWLFFLLHFYLFWLISISQRLLLLERPTKNKRVSKWIFNGHIWSRPCVVYRIFILHHQFTHHKLTPNWLRSTNVCVCVALDHMESRRFPLHGHTVSLNWHVVINRSLTQTQNPHPGNETRKV